MLSALRLLSNFESQLISLERCKALIMTDTESEWKTRKVIVGFDERWPKNGEIIFSNYFTRYRMNLPFVLQNVNIHIRPGEKIGIVGRTGSGKSTIFLALLRIIEPSFGSILVDDVDISQIGLDDLRRRMTIIPQDPMLFEGTLRQNLDLQGRYNDSQLWTALENVCLKEKFSSGEGLNSQIKDEGANLSAGEKQLLCIARAILTKHKIVLIDEATSNIDFVTESTILNTIKKHFADSTVITVAHRLKTIINCDRILVMHEGQSVEFDSPNNLLNDKQSFFTKLWNEYKEEQSLE